MSQKKETYIQPDARGRIQLPKELREFPLFKLAENADGYQLIPLRVVEEKSSQRSAKVWLTAEVEAFTKEVLFKSLSTYLSRGTLSGVVAVFLYGSRARGDALSKSDFDIGLLVGRYPSSSDRNQVCDELQRTLQKEFDLLRAHGVDAEPSFHFFSSQLNEDEVSPIYYSIVTDGRLIWQKGSEWSEFVKRVRGQMKKRRVQAVGEGKKRQWKWVTS